MTDGQTVVERVIASATQHDYATTPASVAEGFFDSIGMMRGSYAPAYRAAFGFAATSAMVWAVRPSFAFDDRGAKPWGVNGTRVPWFLPGLVVGAYCGLFV